MTDSMPKMTDEAPSLEYKYPPITEAIIGIDFDNSIDEETLSSLSKKYLKYYSGYQPHRNINVKFELEIGADGNNPANANVDQENGHRLTSSDMTEVLLLLPQTIVLSQLAPYPGWNTFFDRFTRDWNILNRHLGFRSIKRIGVRYINRIDIPVDGPLIAHENFLNVYANFTDRFGPMSAYAVQIQVFMEDIKCRLAINSGSVQSPVLDCSSFLVDQDISREIDVPQKSEDIFELIEKIRVRKNEVFESCVSDHARALFRHVK